MNLDLQKKWPNNPSQLTAHQTHMSLYNDILMINVELMYPVSQATSFHA